MATHMQPQPQTEPQAMSPASEGPWLGCRWGSPTSTSLTIHEGNLTRALNTLRSTPAAKLSTIRTLHIMFAEPNLLAWHGSYWKDLDIVFDDESIENYKGIFPEFDSPSTPPPREVFCELLRFVADNFDLENLHLVVNVGGAAWQIFADAGAGAYGGDEVEEGPDWKFIYEWYLDVGRVILEVLAGRELLDLSILASIWDGMTPWLTGKITGRESAVPAAKVPRYHDAGLRLFEAGESGDGVVAVKRFGPGLKWMLD